VSALAAELRHTGERLRRTPLPLADLIPLLQKAADAIDNVWISVNDRLPDVSQDVLYTFNGRTFLGTYLGCDNENHLPVFAGRAGWLSGDVMFWMPTPAAPESTRIIK
jgi:hypothetical protein